MIILHGVKPTLDPAHEVEYRNAGLVTAEANCTSDVPARSRSRFTAGRVIPFTLAIWLAFDVGLRFAPLDWLNLYPSQIAARWPGRYAPFIPDLRIESRPSIGEMALKANLPPEETYPPLTFTTDAFGFRHTPPIGNHTAAPTVLVMEGDSFTFGAGLSDEETFPAMLARELNTNTYNAGRTFADPERFLELDWLLERLGPNRPECVVYVLLESFDLDLSKGFDQTPIDQLAKKLLGPRLFTPLKEEARYLKRWYLLWSPISPIRILSTRLYKRLSNDRILPNEYRREIVERKLPDGKRILFEPKYVDRYMNQPDEATTRKTAEYLADVRDELARRHLRFWVLLLPESTSVYGDWLFSVEKPAQRNPQYFHRLEKHLANLGVSMINGLTVLHATAAEDLARGELAYFREDHHWNPKGVHKLARATAAALQEHIRPASYSVTGLGNDAVQ